MKLLKIFFFVFILFAFVSCKQNKKDIKIGFLADTFKIQRWQKDKKYFEEKVNELGGEVLVKSADGDETKQYKLAQELIDEGAKVLVVVATNSNSAAAIVRLAQKNNVKVIAYARLILNCDLDYFLAFNVEKIGELQANYIKNIKPEGNYVLINGDKSDLSTQKERAGVLKSLQNKINSGSIKIIYDAYIDSWSPDEAKYIMKKIIEFSDEDIDAVIVGNDGMATGVYETLKEYGMNKKVLLTGLDAEPIALKRILNGDQSMTVYMSIKKLAYAAAELAMQIAKNNKQVNMQNFTTINNGRKDVPAMIIEPQVVDKNNIESTVIKEGFVTMEEIEKIQY